MLTFSQRKKMALDLCGIYDTEPEVGTIVANLNLADKLFQNAARRPWTRVEVTADVVENQQYYKIPADMVRVAEVRCKQDDDSDVILPLEEVASEMNWNRLNAFPNASMFPTHYFIKGHNEIGIFPIPSRDIEDGLIISYEPRIRDMGVEDVAFTAAVTNGEVTITATTNVFKDSMINNWYVYNTDGYDGNYYKIAEVVDAATAKLELPYLGETKANASLKMGQAAPYPEEYHEAAVDYAVYRFFAMRKDTDTAAMYRSLFDEALEQYKTTYGNKTVSGVVNPGLKRLPNVSDVFANSTLREGA